jgi:hypothetical protein
MSYNVYLAGLRTVGTVAASGDEPMVVGLAGDERYRLTVPHMAVRCGTTGETLTVMGVVEFAATESDSEDNAVVLREPMETLIENHYVAYHRPDGEIIVDTVLSVSVEDEVMTLNLTSTPDDVIPAGTRIYRFGEPSDGTHFQTTLTAEAETEFEAPAPGRFVASDYGYPFVVHITNADNESVFLDAICAYIDI